VRRKGGFPRAAIGHDRRDLLAAKSGSRLYVAALNDNAVIVTDDAGGKGRRASYER